MVNDFTGVFSSELLWSYLIKIVNSIIVLIISGLVIKFGNKYIDNLLKREREKYIRRRNTLILLLRSALRYVIYFISSIIILSIFNVPVASLLAGAGIIGLAVGFGAQSLVKDIINGFFILFEDQFAVGDYIKVASVDGVVEELGLRTTRLRSFAGEIHIIPNGEISQVTNYSSGNMRVMVDVGVAYEEKPSQVIDVLEELAGEIALEKSEVITDGPTVLGVQELAVSSVVIRIWAKVKPMEQWQVARYIRQRIKERLDERGIEIAYPHVVLLSKEGSVEETVVK
ncbi:mechanosensitive ion channel family protein [Halocella sp. SP3-1]|uniref:mechanosensitive ion channel family protein n=1 Tax=Halocella sp. SP3-1 TaxID=2382161 RepID=UPI000F754791|nr:mechanosensitive ion channel family protein [Halocella sp. SP3-1]AZO93579.1 mechanosensitive ion channel family protein [Halocella sp. SP3-1]